MPRRNGITIKEMMNLDVMKNCKMVAGFKSITNTVTRVNIMADPDVFDWVEEGEFLLTTAYFFEKKMYKPKRS